MKRYKDIEKVWFISVVLFFFLYNLPGVPEYGDPIGALIHGAITVGLLWIAVYVGLFAIYKARPPKSKEEIERDRERRSGQ